MCRVAEASKKQLKEICQTRWPLSKPICATNTTATTVKELLAIPETLRLKPILQTPYWKQTSKDIDCRKCGRLSCENVENPAVKYLR